MNMIWFSTEKKVPSVKGKQENRERQRKMPYRCRCNQANGCDRRTLPRKTIFKPLSWFSYQLSYAKLPFGIWIPGI